jgi:hypothetical protein
VSNIDKVLDRVRKFLALADNAGSEHEAALAASRAAKLMEEYQLSEAVVRLDDPQVKPEPILKNERLEPDAPKTNRKRVAWKEAIAAAVARDLGVKFFWWSHTSWTNGKPRKTQDVRGFGRESAIQTWRYTCEYLWRTIDELADKAWSVEGDDDSSMGTTRAWKNAFRIGCAQRIAERIHENRKTEREITKATREAAMRDVGDKASIDTAVTANREALAMTVVAKDQVEVDNEYANYTRSWKGSIGSIGSVSNGDGYSAGKRAGDRVSLGGKRAGLTAGQGRLK